MPLIGLIVTVSSTAILSPGTLLLTNRVPNTSHLQRSIGAGTRPIGRIKKTLGILPS